MFIRNGQALGSILYKDAPRAARPTQTAEPKKRGRPKKTADLRTDTERYADEEAAKARAEIAAKKSEVEVPAQATRAELDDIATKAGVDDPEDLPNKGAVREAITESKETAHGRDDKNR